MSPVMCPALRRPRYWAPQTTPTRLCRPPKKRRNLCRGGPRGVANVSFVSTLKVVPAELAASSDEHREIAGQIDLALNADAPVAAAMPAAYGTVGAVFAAAIDGFETGLIRTGSALAGDYRRMSDALNVASTSYLGVDQASEAAVARSAAFIATEASDGSIRG